MFVVAGGKKKELQSEGDQRSPPYLIILCRPCRLELSHQLQIKPRVQCMPLGADKHQGKLVQRQEDIPCHAAASICIEQGMNSTNSFRFGGAAMSISCGVVSSYSSTGTSIVEASIEGVSRKGRGNLPLFFYPFF